MSKQVKLTITFENFKDLAHFVSRLDGKVKQDYLLWAKCKIAEDKDLAKINFEYSNKN